MSDVVPCQRVSRPAMREGYLTTNPIVEYATSAEGSLTPAHVSSRGMKRGCGS